jgi:hypothetical protein
MNLEQLAVAAHFQKSLAKRENLLCVYGLPSKNVIFIEPPHDSASIAPEQRFAV